MLKIVYKHNLEKSLGGRLRGIIAQIELAFSLRRSKSIGANIGYALPVTRSYPGSCFVCLTQNIFVICGCILSWWLLREELHWAKTPKAPHLRKPIRKDAHGARIQQCQARASPRSAWVSCLTHSSLFTLHAGPIHVTLGR